MIELRDVSYAYAPEQDGADAPGALHGVSLTVEDGEMLAIVGHNGSGKSTLAKHLNALLLPTAGTVLVDGMDTRDEQNVLEIRRRVGLVFQNPDNQIIGTVVEEDVGFGPENLGVPTDEIWKRVEDSLKSVGMIEYRKSSPNKLSGGQKQRLAVATAMLSQKTLLVFDEPTSGLDYARMQEVACCARELADEGRVVLVVTHDREFLQCACDRVLEL